MPLSIRRTAFLSQLEDMQAYISQYEEVKGKQEQVQQENTIIDKNINQNKQQNQYLYNQQSSNDYVNNFLVPPTLNGYNDVSKAFPLNNQTYGYNSQNMYYQQAPQVDPNQNGFMNVGYNGYYNPQSLYNEYYKNFDQNIAQGGMTNNSTGSTAVQSTSPLSYNYGNTMQYQQFMKQDNGDNGYYMNNQFYQNSYQKGNNQLWKPDGGSSVWS